MEKVRRAVSECTRNSATRRHTAISAAQEQNGRWKVLGDPTEGALCVAAAKAGLKHELLEERFQRVGEISFSSERKFSNAWLWGAVLLSVLLQFAVIYIPVLQQAFSTVSLSFTDWLLCAAVASSVLWLRELSKLVARRRAHTTSFVSEPLASGGK